MALKKTVLALTFLLIDLLASEAFSSPAKVNCGFNDYQSLRGALQTGQIVRGPEFKSELLVVLAQEMGPSCKVSIEAVATKTLTTYEVLSANNHYTVSVVTAPGESTRLSIIKVIIID